MCVRRMVYDIVGVALDYETHDCGPERSLKFVTEDVSQNPQREVIKRSDTLVC